ncbi:hypothetical protein JST99_01270 [Candidatus Dependentiae bacterium]|nr:hypothetical protein [Candidatus Dependentiae bacterium]
MKRTTSFIIVALLSVSCVQALLPAKQSVKAYKTGLKNETWTVAVFTQENDPTPFSQTSFKSTSSILPGRGLYFNFDGNSTNYIKVYPVDATKAKRCQGQNMHYSCGQIETLKITEEQALPGSVIRIEVTSADVYSIKIDPPKKDSVEIAVKRDCDIGEACEASWTVTIHDEQDNPTGYTAQVGDDKPAKIRVPANKLFWVHVKAGSSEIGNKKIEPTKKLTNKNVLLVSSGMVAVATQGDKIDTLFDTVKAAAPKKRKKPVQDREFEQFGSL